MFSKTCTNATSSVSEKYDRGNGNLKMFSHLKFTVSFNRDFAAKLFDFKTLAVRKVSLCFFLAE